MVPFAGWEMPVQYSSIIEEHMAVRTTAGLFDVSHMGEILVTGENSINFLESITCNTIATIQIGQVQYNALTNPSGGLVDDLTVYRLAEKEFFIVANASNVDNVYKYMTENTMDGVRIENLSDSYHQIAIQGPLAVSLFSKATGFNPDGLGYYRFKDESLLGETMRISRTGYTGEDGLEIYSTPAGGVKLWNLLLEKCGPEGLVPVGLGARDSLRLEARYPLYGHELGMDITPVESGINFIVKEKEIHYAGYDRIIGDKKNGPARKMMGFLMEGPGLPREDYPILGPDGTEISKTASGGFSPILKKGMGTALLPVEFAEPGKILEIQIRGKHLPIKLVKGPFVKGTAGKI